MLSRRRFPDVITHSVDDDSGAVGVAYDSDLPPIAFVLGRRRKERRDPQTGRKEIKMLVLLLVQVFSYHKYLFLFR
jgi:hypothetical protein